MPPLTLDRQALELEILPVRACPLACSRLPCLCHRRRRHRRPLRLLVHHRQRQLLQLRPLHSTPPPPLLHLLRRRARRKLRRALARSQAPSTEPRAPTPARLLQLQPQQVVLEASALDTSLHGCPLTSAAMLCVPVRTTRAPPSGHASPCATSLLWGALPLGSALEPMYKKDVCGTEALFSRSPLSSCCAVQVLRQGRRREQQWQLSRSLRDPM